MAKKKSESEVPAADDSTSEKTETSDSGGSLTQHTKNYFKNLNKKQKLLFGLAALLLAGGILVLTIKPLRLFALNLFSDANVVVLVLDNTTENPVIGVDVSIDSKTAVTDENGSVSDGLARERRRVHGCAARSRCLLERIAEREKPRFGERSAEKREGHR